MAASTALLSEHREQAASPPRTLALACACSMGHGKGGQGYLPPGFLVQPAIYLGNGRKPPLEPAETITCTGTWQYRWMDQHSVLLVQC